VKTHPFGRPFIAVVFMMCKQDVTVFFCEKTGLANRTGRTIDVPGTQTGGKWEPKLVSETAALMAASGQCSVSLVFNYLHAEG
jgi:hypothetical protein